jgi:hypothetical protein
MNKVQLKKIGKGAIIAGSAAVLTYLLGVLPNVDFGPYTAAVTAVLSIAINAGLKLLESQRSQ